MRRADWTPSEVADELALAAETLRRMPSAKIQGYICLWPHYDYSFGDKLGQEQPSKNFRKATPREITRMEETFGWWRFVDRGEFEILWMRASGKSWKAVCAYAGCSRTTATRDWQYGLCKIAWQLNGRLVNRKIGKERFIGLVSHCYQT